MKYNPPVGGATDDSYSDGDKNAGVDGSIVSGAAIEDPQREIIRVITQAGITPDGDVLTQLDEAIDAKISAATGGGDTSQFLLTAQARLRLPIFPEILSADGKIIVTSPAAGSVRLPAGVDILHRGIFPITTVQFDSATLANKTYHLRMNLSSAVVTLFDLADPAYNPSFLAETDVSFDSTYDDILIARVATDAGNVAVITNLVNKDRHVVEFTDVSMPITEPGENSILVDTPAIVSLDFARRPQFQAWISRIERSPNPTVNTNFKDSDPANGTHDHDYRCKAVCDRYGAEVSIVQDYSFEIDFDAIARM